MEATKNNQEQEDQIDIVALLAKVWGSKKLVLRSVLIFGVLGILIAITTPNQYTASSMFTPNYGGSSSGSGGLKGLASLAGINIGSMSESSKEISPLLYGKIIEGASFKKELLDSPLKNIPEITTLKAYFNQEKTSFSILGTLKKYTIGLPSIIIGFFKADQEKKSAEILTGIESITEEEYKLFEQIDEVLSININDKDGFIEMVSNSKNPQVAAQVAKNAELILQEQIIAIKTKSSLELLRYLETQHTEKRLLLNKAQERLSNFKDRNLSISTNSFSNQQTRLESELRTASAVFDNVVTQLEQVKFQVTKDTPVFSNIKPVVVPYEKSAPKRSLICVIYLFLGFVLSVGFVLAKEPVKDILKQIQTKA
ncbi:MAG: Wzz/FepE/Etk N-terminal domain-containing protein [Winogradskyella sp.]